MYPYSFGIVSLCCLFDIKDFGRYTLRTSSRLLGATFWEHEKELFIQYKREYYSQSIVLLRMHLKAVICFSFALVKLLFGLSKTWVYCTPLFEITNLVSGRHDQKNRCVIAFLKYTLVHYMEKRDSESNVLRMFELQRVHAFHSKRFSTNWTHSFFRIL